jgi:hypothetical protein
MIKKPDKRGRGLTSEDQFDLKQAKASYVAMPGWERIAIWVALGLLLLGIVGDLIW